MSHEEQEGVPLVTLARIFEGSSFRNRDTRITANTLKLSAEYIKLFINEAVLRSNEERISEGNSLNKVDGIDDVANDDADVDAEVSLDEDVDEDDIEIPAPATQYRPREEELGNNVIDTRHLSKVAGVLVLDF